MEQGTLVPGGGKSATRFLKSAAIEAIRPFSALAPPFFQLLETNVNLLQKTHRRSERRLPPSRRLSVLASNLGTCSPNQLLPGAAGLYRKERLAKHRGGQANVF